jgi:chromosome segregation ATPase
MSAPTRQTDQRHVIETPGWAEARMHEYEQSTSQYAGAMDAAYEAREDINRIRAEMKNIEAQVVVNGGFAHINIDGKNAETRTAQLAQCLAIEGTYQDCLTALRAAERAHSQAENEANEASNQMRGARLALEYATAFINRCAAAEGRLELEDRYNHVYGY